MISPDSRFSRFSSKQFFSQVKQVMCCVSLSSVPKTTFCILFGLACLLEHARKILRQVACPCSEAGRSRCQKLSSSTPLQLQLNRGCHMYRFQIGIVILYDVVAGDSFAITILDSLVDRSPPRERKPGFHVSAASSKVSNPICFSTFCFG